MVLFQFEKNCDLAEWRIIDDGVMGGRSQGHLTMSDTGTGIYHGEVSLENNGGFSSLRYRFSEIDVHNRTFCMIRLKGDGKRYQFRLKSNSMEQHSYIFYFPTSGEWETIKIPLADMYPTFRGRKLDMENYPVAQMGEIAFLISNKKKESFRLELDSIVLH